MLSNSQSIKDYDPDLWKALDGEITRQEDHIELIASENYASKRVLEAQGSVLTNKYAEGYPGKRYYGGCQFIDIGEQTEGQLLAKTVTSVKSGSKVAVAINQVDDNGAGPYTCDMDLKGNANGFNGQTNLTVTESAAQNGVINLSVEMPADFACIGGKISRTSRIARH